MNMNKQTKCKYASCSLERSVCAAFMSIPLLNCLTKLRHEIVTKFKRNSCHKLSKHDSGRFQELPETITPRNYLG